MEHNKQLQLQGLKHDLTQAQEAYYSAFSQASIAAVNKILTVDFRGLSDADKAARMAHAPYTKKIRKITEKIEVIELGATKRTLKKKKNTQAKWNRKMAEAPRRLEMLQERVKEKLFAIDTEHHEFSKKLLEVGVSIWENGEVTTLHYVVAENYNSRNQRYVPDNKDNFNFGSSIVLPEKSIMEEVKRHYHGTKFAVGHAFKNDRKFLESCGCVISDKVLDTQSYGQIYFVEKVYMSLEKLATKCGFNPTNLHNAGNDVHYTMLSLLKMAGVKL